MQRRGGKADGAARGLSRLSGAVTCLALWLALCTPLLAQDISRDSATEVAELPPVVQAREAEEGEQQAATEVQEEDSPQPGIVQLLQPQSYVPVEGAQPGLPDNITADDFEISENGLIVAAGSVEISIRSVVNGGTVLVSADYLEYDLESGAAELSGAVSIGLEGSELRLLCEGFAYDPTMETMRVRGIRIAVPLSEIFDPEQLEPSPPELGFDGHIYAQTPTSAYLVAEDAQFSLDSERRAFVLSHVRLSHNSRPDPDLYLRAREVRLTEDERVEFKDISVHLSGIKIFSWPRISRGLRPDEQPLSFNFPVIRIDRDVGVAWKQSLDFAYEQIKAEGMLDYSAEYGLLTHTYAFVEPVAGARIGVQAGTRTAVDADRRTVERREDWNFVYEHDFGEQKGIYRDLDTRIEYGDVASSARFQGPGGQVPIPVEDRRLFAEGDIDLPLVELGDGLYFASGGLYRYVDYADADETYRVYGGRAGLVLRRDGFDHFIQVSSNRSRGEPVIRFDELRKKELAFATSIRILPDWRHVVRGSYDLAGDEFDILEVGAMKRQKSYEIGVYWDFARDNAGFEFGLLTD